MLSTETRNPATTHLDTMSTQQMLDAMNTANYDVPKAVEAALPQISPLVEHIAKQMADDGRMFYVGAGTSGRLGVMDASECPPTFGVSPDCIVAVMAGGRDAMFCANATCEDDAQQGEKDILQYNITKKDTVIGISAAGGAKYVIGAMAAAKKNGAATAAICCNEGVPMLQIADYKICVNTGPEVITGSTRLKAGSAQKMVLNLISSAIMIKQGKVYENYMVNLNPANEKLLKRAISTICSLANCDSNTAQKALENYGNVRSAVDFLRANGGKF